MSIKTTQTITRDSALHILTEIQFLPNKVLEDILDMIADSGTSRVLSKFDNFIVSNASGAEIRPYIPQIEAGYQSRSS